MIREHFGKIYQLLKSPPPGISLGEFPSSLPPMSSFVFDMGGPASNPNAIGHVSTEDVNGDGVLDTIHINSTRMAEELNKLNVTQTSLGNINSLSNEELMPILSAFVELISHELGHIKDFNPDSESPFSGGEGVAEMAAANSMRGVSMTSNGSVKAAKILTELSSKLDSLSQFKYADKIDLVIKKIAQTASPEEQARYNKNLALANRSRASFEKQTGINAGNRLSTLRQAQGVLLFARFLSGENAVDGDWREKSTAAWSRMIAKLGESEAGRRLLPIKAETLPRVKAIFSNRNNKAKPPVAGVASQQTFDKELEALKRLGRELGLNEDEIYAGIGVTKRLDKSREKAEKPPLTLAQRLKVIRNYAPKLKENTKQISPNASGFGGVSDMATERPSESQKLRSSHGLDSRGGSIGKNITKSASNIDIGSLIVTRRRSGPFGRD